MRSSKTVRTGAVLGAVAVLTTGCVGGGGGASAEEDTRPTIEVMYAFSGAQEEGFRQEVDAWAAANDVDVDYAHTGRFNALITTRVQGKDAPDVALFPEPAMMRRLAEDGLLADLSEVLDPEDLASMVPGPLEIGQVDGEQVAVPVNISVKSLVFYPKGPFEEAGYQVPTTFDELLALSEQIAASGTTPWCFGIQSEAATGWPATDWVENLILIQQGADFYRQWVDHEVPFDAPEVRQALLTMERLLLAEGRTNGGRESIAGSGFNTAANPMFEDPPGCYLYRQANIAAQQGGFPEEVLSRIDETVGVFPMPGATAEQRPVLAGGDLVGILSKENEAARDLVRFLASTEFGTHGYGESGNWISPRTDFDAELYPSDTWRTIAGIAQSSTEFVFDGSDQMPAQVGSGAFWRDMTAWISGGQDIATTLANIEESWPD